MNDEFDAGQTDAVAQKSGMTRRSVVRTGANLAWAVPAVSLATAAPALAISPGTEPEEDPKTEETSTTPNGRKGTAIVGGLVLDQDAAPGDVIVTVKSKGKIGGNGGKGWTRNPGANRGRSEYTYVLSTDVPAGQEFPDLKVKLKAVKIKGKRKLPKKSRYFFSNATTGETLATGVIKF
jgi:hypothetical protein